MHQETITTLQTAIGASSLSSDRFVEDAAGRIDFAGLLRGSSLFGRGDELEGRSVLLATTAQLTTASALIELDGVARRIVLWLPDWPVEHLPYVIEAAEVDSVVSDRMIPDMDLSRSLYFCPCSRNLVPFDRNHKATHETEWILLTSGTTGRPKLVVHTLASLTAAIESRGDSSSQVVWSTFYDIRRYGGLQILLRAALTGASLVLSNHEEPVADFLARAGSSGVTHISGTPSHWRRALMSPSAKLLNPEYVRLSGEAVDQAILNSLRTTYPKARMVHAFASTEAGVAFEVRDGDAGFPASTLKEDSRIELKIEDNTLRIRSAGAARRYLGDGVPTLKDQTGFIDTADTVELRDGRYYFTGRRDGVINIGGLKVYPEEVEAAINRHPDVQMCLVRAKKSPITGALVVADVVLKTDSALGKGDSRAAQADILQHCHELLAAHKVPVAIHIVSELPIGDSGKVMRRNA
ncbi:MAG TPA: fatty acid--CoA ligase family protein [Terracidiphilus sp.]